MKDFRELYLALELRCERGEISWKQAMAAAVTLALNTESEPGPRSDRSEEALRIALRMAGETMDEAS